MRQSGRNTQMPKAIGTDKISAVKADNCCGERFFVLNMFVHGPWLIVHRQLQFSFLPWTIVYRPWTKKSQLEFITHPFYGGNAIHTQFLPNFTDMHING